MQCSNFSCCGANLLSFHDLIDHFERVHVLILDASGKPFYPEVATVPSTPPSPTCSTFSTLSSGSSSGASTRSLTPPSTGAIYVDHEARARARMAQAAPRPGWPHCLGQVEMKVPFPNFARSPAPLPPRSTEPSLDEYLVDWDVDVDMDMDVKTEMDSDAFSDVLPSEPPCSSSSESASSSSSSSPAPESDVLPVLDEGSISASEPARTTTHHRTRSPVVRRARAGRPRQPSCPDHAKERFYPCPVRQIPIEDIYYMF